MGQGNNALTDSLLGGGAGLLASGMGKKGPGSMLPLLLGGAAGFGLSQLGKKSPLGDSLPDLTGPLSNSENPYEGAKDVQTQPGAFAKGTPDAPWSNYNTLPDAAKTNPLAPSTKLDLSGPLTSGPLAGATPTTNPLANALDKQGVPQPSNADKLAGAANAASDVSKVADAAKVAGAKGLGSALGKANPYIEGLQVVADLHKKKLAQESPVFKSGGYGGVGGDSSGGYAT